MLELPERITKDLDTTLHFDWYQKNPTPVRAIQMNKTFRVRTKEGDYNVGKPGDYLICNIVGELYIYDREIFEKNYNWVVE